MSFQEQQDFLKRVQQPWHGLKDVSKRRLSDYVKLTTGRVASKNALGLGALVGASVLMELFLTGTAHATGCQHSQWHDGTYCHNRCTQMPPEYGHECLPTGCEDTDFPSEPPPTDCNW